jgi:hypothetical protein
MCSSQQPRMGRGVEQKQHRPACDPAFHTSPDSVRASRLIAEDTLNVGRLWSLDLKELQRIGKSLNMPDCAVGVSLAPRVSTPTGRGRYKTDVRCGSKLPASETGTAPECGASADSEILKGKQGCLPLQLCGFGTTLKTSAGSRPLSPRPRSRSRTPETAR